MVRRHSGKPGISGLLDWAIELFGTEIELARALGVSAQAVCIWATGRNRVPPKRAIQIQEITGGRVTVADLRPDLVALLKPPAKIGPVLLPPPPPPPRVQIGPQMITMAELGRRLGISKQRISLLHKQGRIPGAVPTGAKWRYPENTTILPRPPPSASAGSGSSSSAATRGRLGTGARGARPQGMQRG